VKCALVIPAWRPEDIFPAKTAGSQINYWQPIGTLYVASYLMSKGHDVRFVNGAFTSHAEILRGLSEFKPGFVGLYSTTFGWKNAKKTAAAVKNILPGSFIVVGGPYPIAAQERCLEDCPHIDAVVTGEGELTSAEILERLEAGKGLEGVLGAVYRKDGIIAKNPPRPLITDLDSLPFPSRELLDNANSYIPPPATYKRRPVAVMITSRGCNRRCIYCFQIDKKRELGIRKRGLENVLDEIELVLKQGYREIKFLDDTLAADYDRAMAFARGIKERKLDFTWFASACVNQVDKPLLEAFKEAGCWAVLFGAESGVQKNLNTIRKGITLEQTRAAVRAAKEVGLTVSTPFLFGLPGETYEEGLETIEFACRLNPDIANFHALTPFPGTELWDNLDRYGRASQELTDFTYQGAAFVPYTMTREQIAALRQMAFKRFYSRPSFLLKKLLALRTANDFQAAWAGIKSLFWIWLQKSVFRRAG
jgi:anaerobic magnesium-protoporphyrin IX monomethyl ester cyclase